MVPLIFCEDDESIIDRGNINEDGFHKNIMEHRDKEETSGNPLRDSGNGAVGMIPIGCIQPWLMSADAGSLFDIINKQEPRGTRALPKPELPLEYRGPKIMRQLRRSSKSQHTGAGLAKIQVLPTSSAEGNEELRKVLRAGARGLHRGLD